MSRHDDPRAARTKRALERVTDGVEPDLSHLMTRASTFVAEAARRRHASHEAPGIMAATIPVAQVAIPRLAVAAVMLVLVSISLLWLGDSTVTGVEAAEESFETLVLGGDGAVTDESWVLESVLAGTADE